MCAARRVIVPIVEGHAEVEAVPDLLRRWLAALGRAHTCTIAAPIRSAGAAPLKAPFDAARELGIEYFVRAALRARPDGILVLLDADLECDRREAARREALGPELLRRARHVAAHVAISVVIADPEYEAWFLRHAPLVFPEHASHPLEAPRGSKAAVERLIGRKYHEMSDQRAFTKRLPTPTGDEVDAIADRSYRKLCREVLHLFGDD